MPDPTPAATLVPPVRLHPSGAGRPPRRLRRAVLLTAATVVLALVHPMPAGADPSGGSTVTVTVEGGALELTVSTEPTDLGSVKPTSDGTTVSGALGEVTVRDNRNAAAGATWVASVVATDFAAEQGQSIPASRISYTAGRIRGTGTVTLRANETGNLRRPRPAVTATGITGNNTARWTPTVHVHVPPGLLAGVYTGTITHSVA